MGPRGFEIFNPPPPGGGVLLHKIGTCFEDRYRVKKWLNSTKVCDMEMDQEFGQLSEFVSFLKHRLLQKSSDELFLNKIE